MGANEEEASVQIGGAWDEHALQHMIKRLASQLGVAPNMIWYASLCLKHCSLALCSPAGGNSYPYVLSTMQTCTAYLPCPCFSSTPYKLCRAGVKAFAPVRQVVGA